MAHKFKKYFSSKKRYLTALLVLLLLVLMTTLELTNTTYLFHKQKTIPVVTPTTSDNTKTPTTTPNTTNTDSKPSDSNTTSDNTQSASGTITISRVGQSTGSTTVSLRTVVNGINSGNCIVVFSKTGQPDVQQTAAVVSNANYYSCGVVDIPVSQFTVSGAWSVSVRVVDSKSVTISNIATANNIQVQK